MGKARIEQEIREREEKQRQASEQKFPISEKSKARFKQLKTGVKFLKNQLQMYHKIIFDIRENKFKIISEESIDPVNKQP